MAEQASMRLNKVLIELNISLDRAVEYLLSKGYDIDARPTAKISDEVYHVLLEEFQTDRNKREASKEIGEEKRKEKEAIRLAQEKEQELKKIQQEQQEIIRAKAALAGIKTVGKIELEPAKPVAEKRTDEPAPKKEEPKPEETTAAAEDVKEEIAPTIPPTEVKEPSTIIETKYQKLSKPVIIGEKIDLTQFEKSKKKKEPEKETANTAEREKARKKRRKRINLQDTLDKELKTGKPGMKDAGNRIPGKVEPSEEEIQKQVRETLEKLQGKGGKSKGAKYRREKRDSHRQRTEEDIIQQELESKVLRLTEFVTVAEVATLMKVPITQVIGACMSLGIMVTMNQRLDAETLSIIAEEFGYEVEFVSADLEEVAQEVEDKAGDLEPRAPVVTVMGHVDHGKTSLLDYIRKENVIAGESGGITQHIGAYSVVLDDGQKITFLDTPGHEAFTAMRARGAKVTDLVIIVVAADDDVMPQTKEAISHAQAAGVPIIFAINKIDKPNANADKIKQSLAAMNLLVEDWGGKIQSQEISAKTGQGVKELLEKVLLEAELLELKANPRKNASGTVVESFLDKGKGYVCTILVQGGTLHVGDYVLAGRHSGKVKAMQDERGHTIKEAGPATPVSVLGLDGAPQAGDTFRVYEDEREAKQIATKRMQLQREQSIKTQRHITLDEIGRRIALGDFKELNIVLKGDVDGSVEALTDSFQKLSTEKIHINIIHKAVGAITESDVLLASASDAIIIGFNVRPMGGAKALAEREEIDIRNYSIIYDAINDLKDAMEGMLSPEVKEEITGTAEVREIFKISKVGIIAGCMVTDGKIYKNSNIRVIRDGVVIQTGELASLKRFKDDVKEVAKGYDCGLQLKNYNDLKEGDILEAFQEVTVKKG